MFNCNVIVIEPHRAICKNLKRILTEEGFLVVAIRDTGTFFDLDTSGELKKSLDRTLPTVVLITIVGAERVSDEDLVPPEWKKHSLPEDNDKATHRNYRLGLEFSSRLRRGDFSCVDADTPIILNRNLTNPWCLEGTIEALGGSPKTKAVLRWDLGRLANQIRKMIPLVTMIEEQPATQ